MEKKNKYHVHMFDGEVIVIMAHSVLMSGGALYFEEYNNGVTDTTEMVAAGMWKHYKKVEETNE